MSIIIGGMVGGTAIGVAPASRWIAVKIYDDKGEANLELVGYGPMMHKGKKKKWAISIKGVGGNPGTVTVSGIEGSESVPVE